jgi:hypothetical protein
MLAVWLCDAGLFPAIDEGVYRITNQGQDYLPAIRDDNLWHKTKSASGKLGGVTLGMMTEIAVSFLKRELADRTGLRLWLPGTRRACYRPISGFGL